MKSIKNYLWIVMLTVSLAVTPALAGKNDSKGKGGGGGKTADDGPADPVFVLTSSDAVDVMNIDGSNQTSLYVGSGVSFPKWIPGENRIIFGEFSDYIFKTVGFEVVSGEVVPGSVENLFYSPESYQPSWLWGPNGGEVLFYREPDPNDRGAFNLEIVDLSNCTVTCAADIIYQSPLDYELVFPIRSQDGTKVWAIEEHYDSAVAFYEEGFKIIEVDLTTGAKATLVEGVFGHEHFGRKLAEARSFNGFAYNIGNDTYVYNADLGLDFTSASTLVSQDGVPLSFNSDDSTVAVRKRIRNRTFLYFVYLDGSQKPIGEEQILKTAPTFDWKH